MPLFKTVNLRNLRWHFVLACTLVTIQTKPVFSQTERILNYDSRIVLSENGNLTVQETIQVVAAGDQIRRGIYRTFPTRYKDRQGNPYVIGFDVVEVTRDGQTEPYHTKNLSNGIAVYIGDQNIFLQAGTYTYSLTYRTDHQLGFFKQYDELYWNVTGNEWNFNIEKASATVELPENIRGRVLESDAWTGSQGSTERAFRKDGSAWPLFRFETTRVLSPKEGFTIVISWPKGLIPEPTTIEKIQHTLRGDVGLFMAAIGTFLLLAYYLVVWFKVGRDPEKGVIVPLYSMPDDLSPAAVRYIHRMGYDHKTFASALLDMAVKGFLRIEEKGGIFTLTRLGSNFDALSPEEKKITEALLPSNGSIELKQVNHTAIQKALDEMKNVLKQKFNKTYFLTNRGYFVPGILFSIVLLVVSTLSYRNAEAGFLTVWLSVWSAGVAVLVGVVIHFWKMVLGGRISAASTVGALGLTLFSIPFIAGEVFGLFGLWQNTSTVLIAALVANLVMNIVFYRLLKAPTLLGRKTLDKIEGFKLFLGTAEKERLKWAAPPDRTPQTFERFLPYALALGVEQAWAEKFSSVLAGAGSSSTYQPTWYRGSSWTHFDASSFASSFGGSLTSAISSSSTAPGSSSGSGGGGSSGGGGGGGGGGGW